MDTIEFSVTFLSLAIWIGLLGWRGQFWRADEKIKVAETKLSSWPRICAIIPARNEADVLPNALRELLTQDYPGCFTTILVDDNSTDGTASIAENVARSLDKSDRLHIVSGSPLPPGWSGKLWALEQGISYAMAQQAPPDYFLLTDADIEHDKANLRQLVTKAEQEDLDMVSLMVLLRCEIFWEKLLIPAFVFFFQKLYPFPWVNDRNNNTAAAAGGCILIRREALTRIGGIEVIRNALIDDCALARAVKSTSAKGGIWLGLTNLTRSLRPYPSLSSIWEMVARTAFTQLNYSQWLLLATILGLILIYIVSPVAAIWGGLIGNWLMAVAGLSGWLLMSLAYLPTIRLYKSSPLWAFSLPVVALLYTLMTLDSAIQYWQGRGGAWKGRVYKGNTAA